MTSSIVQRMSLVCLILASVAAGLRAAEVESVDVVEGTWHTFQCNYDQASDTKNYHELGVNVLKCNEDFPMTMESKDFTLVAAVFGSMTANFGSDMKETLMNNQEPPVYYANQNNNYVKDGLVQILDGGPTSINIRINATARMDRICVACAQTVGSKLGFTETKKISLKLRSPPTASMTLDNTPVNPNERKDFIEGQAVKIGCTAAGPETLSVMLMKNDKEVSRSATSSLTYEIPRTSKEKAGVYKCLAVTSLPFLVQLDSNTGSVEFVLAVKFAPQIELSEIVRYTPLGRQEDIRIDVPSYPAAELKCDTSNPSDLTERLSYNDREFVAGYRVVLSNLHNVNNETLFECTATNEMGQQRLQILLTAKAPKPTILGTGKTEFHNSYTLRWKHDRNASIERYEIQIVYKYGDDFQNTTRYTFEPNAQRGTVAGVDQEEKAGQIHHSGVVFGLNADSEHDIQLRSCNQHGCSEYSKPISVRTPPDSGSNSNDPKNPQKSLSGNRAPTVSASVAALGICLSLAFGLRRPPL